MRAWRTQAACRDSPDPDAWFTERNSTQGLEVAEYALGFCRRCPVQPECLETAFAQDERWGIWGARTNADRGWYGLKSQPARTVGGSA